MAQALKIVMDHGLLALATLCSAPRLNPWILFATQFGTLVIMLGDERRKTTRRTSFCRGCLRCPPCDHARSGLPGDRIGEASHFGPESWGLSLAPASRQWGPPKAMEELERTAIFSRTWAGQGDKGTSDANRNDGRQRPPPKALLLEGPDVVTEVDVAHQTAPRAPTMSSERSCGKVPGPRTHSGWTRSDCLLKFMPWIVRFLLVRLCLLADAQSDTALHANVGGTTTRRWSTTACMARIGRRMPVQGQTRIAATFRSFLEVRCQRLHRSALAVWINSGKDSYLHLEAALRELLRDRAMNCGSSHGQVTLAPYQRGRICLRDQRSVKSRRW